MRKKKKEKIETARVILKIIGHHTSSAYPCARGYSLLIKEGAMQGHPRDTLCTGGTHRKMPFTVLGYIFILARLLISTNAPYLAE